MSYNNVKNEKQISKKRAVFGASKNFSDVLESQGTEDFGGGCFFGKFADVPENGYSVSLNMDSRERAPETRKEPTVKTFEKAVRRARVNDLLYGVNAHDFYPIGNASVRKEGENFLINCNFFAEDDEEYTDPGLYITRRLAAGKYLFRLCLGSGTCPKIKIYESISSVQYNGRPSVKTNSEGMRYVQIEFEAQEKIRIEMTYSKGASETLTHRFVRPMILDMSAAISLGAAQAEVEGVFFDGEYGACEGIAEVPEGEADAEIFADGRYVFQKGSRLFSVKAASGECFLESLLLPEGERAAIYRYGDGFIALFKNGEAFVTNDLEPGAGVKRSVFHTPVHYRIYDPSGDLPYEKAEEISMFNEYFYVQLLLGSSKTCKLPESLRVDTEFCEAYDPENMSLLPEGEVKLSLDDNGAFVLTEDSACYGILVKLRLSPEDSFYPKIKKCRELLFSPSGSEVFQSVYGKGHNIVLYGGENGAEFIISALSENMYSADEQVLLSKNTEKISAVLRYSENFLVFSPHYIRKMIVSEKEGGAFEFSMQNFKYDIGCDMPGSAVCADDKIIYANSRAGVFYIDRFGFSQKDMSRHVSSNIEPGENGLLLCDEADLMASEAAVCDGKYFLRVGEFFYIWDFAHALPSATEKASEERKLKWLMYSGLSCARLLGADEEKLYFISEDGAFASLAKGTSLASGAESYFCSREYSLAPFCAATIWKLSLSLAAKEACTVRLYFDGEEGSAKYTLTPDGVNSTLCIIRPEARKCRRFAFSLHSFGAVRLDGVNIEYLCK